MIHKEPHPMAGRVVMLRAKYQGPGGGVIECRVEDWFDRVVGRSWRKAVGNAAAVAYAGRSVHAMLPDDDAVLYGKVDGFGVLVHESEILTEADRSPCCSCGTPVYCIPDGMVLCQRCAEAEASLDPYKCP